MVNCNATSPVGNFDATNREAKSAQPNPIPTTNQPVEPSLSGFAELEKIELMQQQAAYKKHKQVILDLAKTQLEKIEIPKYLDKVSFDFFCRHYIYDLISQVDLAKLQKDDLNMIFNIFHIIYYSKSKGLIKSDVFKKSLEKLSKNTNLESLTGKLDPLAKLLKFIEPLREKYNFSIEHIRTNRVESTGRRIGIDEQIFPEANITTLRIEREFLGKLKECFFSSWQLVNNQFEAIKDIELPSAKLIHDQRDQLKIKFYKLQKFMKINKEKLKADFMIFENPPLVSKHSLSPTVIAEMLDLQNLDYQYTLDNLKIRMARFTQRIQTLQGLLINVLDIASKLRGNTGCFCSEKAIEKHKMESLYFFDWEIYGISKDPIDWIKEQRDYRQILIIRNLKEQQSDVNKCNELFRQFDEKFLTAYCGYHDFIGSIIVIGRWLSSVITVLDAWKKSIISPNRDVKDIDEDFDVPEPVTVAPSEKIVEITETEVEEEDEESPIPSLMPAQETAVQALPKKEWNHLSTFAHHIDVNIKRNRDDAWNTAILEDVMYQFSLFGAGVDSYIASRSVIEDDISIERLYPLVRGGLISEQLLAKMLQEKGEETHEHHHLEMARELKIDKKGMNYLLKVDYSSVFTRSINHYNSRYREPSLTATWLHGSKKPSDDEVSSYVRDTVSFFEKHTHSSAVTDVFKAKFSEKPDKAKLPSRLRKLKQSLEEIPALGSLLQKTKTMIDVQANNPVLVNVSLCWAEAHFHLTALNSQLQQFSREPVTHQLQKFTDLTLLHLKETYEAVKLARYMQRDNVVYNTHNLEELDGLLDEVPKGEVLQAVKAINVKSGAQTPNKKQYRLAQKNKPIPEGIELRLKARALSQFGDELDCGNNIKTAKSSTGTFTHDDAVKLIKRVWSICETVLKRLDETTVV